MRATRLATSLFAILLSAGTAIAEDDDSSPFTRSGFYVGVGAVYASDIFEGEIEDVIEDAFGFSVRVDVEESWGASARLGYRFGPFFATEIQYEWIDKFDIDLSAAGLPVGGASLEANTLTLNTKLIAPIWRTQPYLLAGIGGALYDFDDNTPFNLLGGSDNKAAFAGRAGGGLDLHLTEHFVLNAEATVLLTTADFKAPEIRDLDDLYYVSASIGFRYQF